MMARNRWNDAPGTNMLDTGLPFCDTYETADGRFIAVGALGPQVYAQFISGLGLHPGDIPGQHDSQRKTPLPLLTPMLQPLYWTYH